MILDYILDVLSIMICDPRFYLSSKENVLPVGVWVQEANRNSVFSTQFCCESETTLKYKTSKNKYTNKNQTKRIHQVKVTQSWPTV